MTEGLDSLFKPWWLSPSVFFFVMLLLAGVSLGILGFDWWLTQHFEWLLKVALG